MKKIFSNSFPSHKHMWKWVCSSGEYLKEATNAHITKYCSIHALGLMLAVLVKKQGLLLFISTSLPPSNQLEVRAEAIMDLWQHRWKVKESECRLPVLQVNLVLLSPLGPVSHLLCNLELFRFCRSLKIAPISSIATVFKITPFLKMHGVSL